MAAALRLRDATVEAEAGGRAVVDVSALREGGFGEVSVSLGPVQATDGAGGSIGTAALVAGDLVFSAAAGAEGRTGAVEVTAIDGLGQVGGATIALEVARAVPQPSPPVESEAPDGPTGDDAAPDPGDGPARSPGEEPGEPDIPAGPPDRGDAGVRDPDGQEAPGALLLRGTEGRDRLFGTAADERFEGLDGRDVLVSGGGRDVMTGGEGPDFFAFARVPEAGRTEITDFGPQDFVVFDDRFFGLGGPQIALRSVTQDQAVAALRLGLVAIDRDEGLLTVDPDRDAAGSAPLLTLDLGAGLAALGVQDVFLA
jgi:Ca2+-binding RTX toxin-like protein